MAQDRTTSAREFLFADRETQPRLSDWLIKDLKGARRSSAPPPPEPLESGVETVPAERAQSEAVETEPEAVAQPATDVAGDDVPPELDDSGDLAASLSYAHEGESSLAQQTESSLAQQTESSLTRQTESSLTRQTESSLTQQTESEPLAPESVATESVGTKVYADPEDWLDDDRDSETTAAFFTPKPVLEEDDDDGSGAIDELAPAETGESLSPQVLAPEDESDDGAAVVVAGVGGMEWWKVAAGVAAALLLLFMVVHRTKKAPQAATAAQADIVAPATPPAATPALAETAEETSEPESETKGSRGGAYYGGRSHMSSASDTSQDPSISGGPSVARFPDLPREILMQLEQAFEAGEQQHGKSSTDSVERY